MKFYTGYRPQRENFYNNVHKSHLTNTMQFTEEWTNNNLTELRQHCNLT